MNITAVDIDPAMLSIATKYFGLVQDEHLNVVIEDGIQFLTKAAKNGKNFKAILFDVDSKDSSLGMSCPPVQFLEPVVLEAVKSCIKDNGEALLSNLYSNNSRPTFFTGLFILNLVSRDEKLREKVLIDLKNSFKFVASYKLQEDVNEILYCQNLEQDSAKWKSSMEKSVKNINEMLSKQLSSQETVEVEEFLSELKL